MRAPLSLVLALMLCGVWGLRGHPRAAQAAPAPSARTWFWVDPAPRGPKATATSNVVFLNNCLASNGCALLPGRTAGENDSRTNTSSIVSQPSLLEKWRFSQVEWENLVACVRDVFAPFEIQIVTTEPTADTSYFEAMVAGRASQLGLEGSYAGVAPFNCGVIDNAITFTFANDYADLGPQGAGDLCWTVVQEVAHAFGLQHKYDARDPMTYLPPALPIKLFLDEDGPCGTNAARDCTRGDAYEPRGCPGPATTNSYRRVAELFGARPGTPPELMVTAPGDGAVVSRGFLLRATARDDVRLRDVALSIDGVPQAPVLRTGPFEWRTAKTLAEGEHVVRVVATDYYGAATARELAVTVRPACSGQATGCDAGQLCVEGRCVAGPEQEGGLGQRCAGNEDCASGLCAAAGGDKHCVEECTAGADGCPSEFSCRSTGAGAVCWPADASGSCAAGGGAIDLPLALSLLFAALVLAPRLRRRPRSGVDVR